MPGLRRAERGHLALRAAEQAKAPAAPAAVEPEVQQTAARTPAKTASKPATSTVARKTAKKAAPRKTAAAKTISGIEPRRSPRVKLSEQYRFPQEFAETLKDAIFYNRDRYAEIMAERSSRPHRLSLAGLVDTGVMWALDRADEWLADAPDSAKSLGQDASDWVKLLIVWRPESIARVNDEVFFLNKRYPGNRLTKAGLIRGAMTYALDHLDDWLGDVPNDARLAEPRETDLRLKANRLARG